MVSPIDALLRRLVILLVIAAPAVVIAQADDDHDHSGEAHVADASLSPEMRVRVRYLESQIMCDCKKENYSRTLTNCADACANPQKRIVEQMVLGDRSDDEIYETMLSRVGGDRRVLASAASSFGFWAYALPFVLLVAGAVFALKVINGWSRSGSEARAERQRSAALVSGGELERVERELAELD